MSLFVYRHKNDKSEMPKPMKPELAQLKIRVCSAGYPETGSLYFEGTVKTFIIERMPHATLAKMLPLLLTEPRFTYRPGTETLLVERLED
jgi:hypothetical protein